MRYVTVRVTPAEGEAFHPIGQALADEPSITREAIHRVELLADGTGIMLGESRGDRDAYEAILAESDYVIEYAVTGAESRWYAYLHFEPTETTRSMIEQLRQSPVMLEMPVPADEDGAMLLTSSATARGSRTLSRRRPTSTTSRSSRPASGPRRWTTLFACLTARQQEILEAAVEHGYYENPRRATHEDVAAVVDAAPSTVGEHLRKIEQRVFSQFTGP